MTVMKKIKKLGIGAAMLGAAAIACTSLPASAQEYYGAPYTGYYGSYAYPQQYRYYDRGRAYGRYAQYRYAYNPYGTPPAIRCEQKRQTNTAGGAVLGAIVGGLFGNSISHHDRGAGTAIGAIAGGLLGASVGNSLSCQNQPYGYYGY